MDTPASELKARLRADLTAAIKGRDELRSSTLRMALTAVSNEEVSGKTARGLSDDEVLAVLGREAKKRRESAEAYDGAQRPELAERERAELGVLEDYLPSQLTEDELAAIIDDAMTEAGAREAANPRAALGSVMKLVQARTSGRADGGKVAAEVRRRLEAG